jgi:O-antigen/teichoic acid export membrane protein
VSTSLQQFLLVAVPKVTSGVLQLAVNLFILTKIRPEESGILFVCLTLVTLIDAILGAAVDTGVIRLATGENAGTDVTVQKAALWGKLSAVVAVALPVLIWRDALSEVVFRGPGHGSALLLTLCALAGMLAFRSVQTYFQLAGEFKLYGAAELAQSFLKFGGAYALVATGLGTSTTILLCFILGPVLTASGLLLFSARPLLAATFSYARLSELFRLVRWYLCAAAVGSLTSRMDLLLVSAQQGTRAAGIFSAAQALIVVFHLLGTYIGIVCAPKVLPLHREGRLAGIYWRFQLAAVALCITVIALFPPAVDLLARWLPATYAESRPIMVTLLPSALTSVANFPWTVTFLLFFHPRSLFVAELVALPLLAWLYQFSIGRNGILGAAFVTTGYAVLKTIAFQILAWHTLRATPEEVVA